ncbi:molybdopterin molybdotransferase MoeA [Mucilaginibacter litoreus]|uniref:Molybdopterin molybdenumtransferase n=1 Tax=Mucilaginibacter litoreus TaxID=1048221 RepID=A0ABW3ATX3_9SPHI
MDMISVEEAEKIILAQEQEYGTEVVPFEHALGRVLAENIVADRDLPPYNRATMDGIAITYQAFVQQINTFTVRSTQAAGESPVNIININECVEIMTGAALSASVDTVIRYEDIEIKGGLVFVLIDPANIKQGQNIHQKGKDKKQGDIAAKAGLRITPAIISLAASVGKTRLKVKKLPKIIVISSGDELVDVVAEPLTYQIRRSNNYMVKAALSQHGIIADLLHIPDDPLIIAVKLKDCLQKYDVILLSGGISMGKFDYIPAALENSGAAKLFHKVTQRPGKPFWFGKHPVGTLVFAFPGNPVATFMCLHRYFLPWLNRSLNLPQPPTIYARLATDFTFTPPLQYFLQVKLNFTHEAVLTATPVEGNGSGDFANLVDTDAFIELPANRTNFKAGEVFKVWKF